MSGEVRHVVNVFTSSIDGEARIIFIRDGSSTLKTNLIHIHEIRLG